MDAQRWARLKDIFAHASELPPEQRHAYLEGSCGDDAALRAEVESLLSAHDTEDSFIEHPAAHRAGLTLAASQWIGRRVGPWRIVDELGRGGMSEVYKAVRDDQQYEKDVAIKVLRHGFDTESLLRRFRVERQILAQLSHPNIAHLLDGSTTDEGLPYLVMEFIQGRPIDDYCEQQQLGLRERLDLFRTLCGAVQYVHQHLMVHGDLKCNNVLVTDRGVVKLLDFGIAKLLNPTPALAPPDGKATGFLAMTPDYASPEQVRGEPITTASDVYSLGVVLYRLLAGQLPYRVKGSTSYDLAMQICEHEPLPPSAVAAASDSSYWRFARELRGDLDNIVMKALRKSPDERYGSAEQLNDDLRRYLRGFPVRARPDSTYYRLSKFVLRHRAATAAMFLFMVALLAGVVTTSWQAHIAQRERERAERHFDTVRKLVDSYMFEVHDAIENLPGATVARKMLVENSLKYLSELAREAQGSPAVLSDLAAAYEKLGDLQGRFRGPNLGDTQGARESYRKAIQLREDLLARMPSDRDLQRDLIRNHGKMSETLQVSGEGPKALDHADRLLILAQALGNSRDATTTDRRNLGNAMLANGWLKVVLGDVDAGINLMRSALPFYEEVLASAPEDRLARRNLSLVYSRIGDALSDFGERPAEALQYFERARDEIGALYADHPENTDLRRILGFVLVSMGDAWLAQNNPQRSLPLHEEGFRHLDALRAADPANQDAPFGSAYALGQIAAAHMVQGDAERALKDLSRAQTMLRQLSSPDAEQLAEAHYYIGILHLQLGEAHAMLSRDQGVRAGLRTNHARESRQWLQRAIDRMERAVGDPVLAKRAARRLQKAQALLNQVETAVATPSSTA